MHGQGSGAKDEIYPPTNAGCAEANAAIKLFRLGNQNANALFYLRNYLSFQGDQPPREVLKKLKVVVLPEMITVSRADTVLASDERLLDVKSQKSIDHLGQRLVTVCGALTETSG
jgi:hypothetical protein